MRVYYLTGAHFALSNIALRRVKISRFGELNDPFELLAVNITDKTYRRAYRATRKQIDETKGLICFSRSWKNPLLWGHYAEKHTGIGLGFDIPDELLYPVIYAKRLIKLEVDPQSQEPILTEKVMKKLLRTKFYDWKYENEMRLFVGLDIKSAESGKYYYDFSENLVLREVILGPRCDLPIEGICKLVDSFEPRVQVIKSRIAFSRFEVLKSTAKSPPR